MDTELVDDHYFPDYVDFLNSATPGYTVHNGSEVVMAEIINIAEDYVDMMPGLLVDVKNMGDEDITAPGGREPYLVNVNVREYNYGDLDYIGWSFFDSLNSILFDWDTLWGIRGKSGTTIENRFERGVDGTLDDDAQREYISHVDRIIEEAKNQFYPARADVIREDMMPSDDPESYQHTYPPEVVDLVFENADLQFKFERAAHSIADRFGEYLDRL